MTFLFSNQHNSFVQLFLIALIIVAPGNIYTQNPSKNSTPERVNFNHLTVNEGLSQNSAISIAQDSLGYLWIATQDGLNRYDGNNITKYLKKFDDITRENYSILGKVYVDLNGFVWIITTTGNLEIFLPGSSNFKQIKTPFPISTILQLNDNTYLLGTYNHGFYVIKKSDENKFNAIHYAIENQTVYDFIEFQSKIFVAAEHNIYSLKDGEIKKINNSRTTNEPPFFSSLETSGKELFIGTFGQGLHIFNPISNKIEQFRDGNNRQLWKQLNIQDLKLSNEQTLWIGTYGDGAFKMNIDDHQTQQYIYNKYDNSSINYNDILCLYEDISGNVWFGTDGGGASFFDAYLNKFNGLTNRQVGDSVQVDVIRSIAVTPNGDMWLGTSGKGLTFVSQDGLEMKTYNTSNSPISSNRIMSLLYDDGRLLIGTQGNGLDILTEGKHWQHFNVTSNPSLNAKTIWTIKKNKEGFWLGSRDNGLILFDIMNGTIEEFNNNLSTENSIISNNIRAIEEDKGGNIWIASSDRGLCSFNRNTRRFSYYNNIPDELKSLYYDEKRDILWIGTNGYGLYEFKPNTGEVNATYTLENESLLNNVVYGILEDDENHLWLSSNKGLTEFDLDNHTTKHYNRFDGLQGLEFNTGAYFQHANGTLYFGGLNGINWFKPNQIETNPNAPNTVITDLQINGNSYPIEKHHQFEPSNNTLTFTFSALHFSQPQRNNYMYLLEGYDEDWTLSGFGNRAHYTKLPPGDYTFKVKSSNYDGVWGEEITTFPFSIKKPWYISNLAIASYLLLFGILIWLLLNYLRWRWKIQMQLKAEHQQAEYFKELNEIKTKLYTNISHEIRTPLTLIRGPVINQLNRKDLSKKDQKELALLNRNTERLMDLVNQMNDLSRIDSGQMKVVETKGDLSNFLKQIIQGFEYKAKEKDITIQHNLQAIPPALFDPDILEKIISNLLSNAVKYAPINSIVKISADLINSNMVLSIVNSNSQVNVKNLNRMFDRFYQNDHKSEGMGVGLALVKELVELCQGQIIANNLQEDKIQFTVTLPLKIEKIHETSVNEKININSKDTIDELTKLKPSILIVEDNVEIRKFLVSILTTDYKIFEADNGEKGFLMATEKLPDLIISDIMMPIMDGREFCKKIKSNSTTSTIPVILLTAISGSKNEVKGLEDGADGYVTKPFNPQKLLLTIENMLKSVSKLKDRYAHNIITNKGIETYKIEEKFLDDLKSVLDKNLTDPNFTADKFCRLMGMSRTQLHRKLKSIAGFSTTEFIRKQRLQLGEVLLRESDATVSEIAYQLGFNSSSYFIKCFKKDYNCTPDEYRNSA